MAGLVGVEGGLFPASLPASWDCRQRSVWGFLAPASAFTLRRFFSLLPSVLFVCVLKRQLLVDFVPTLI